MDEQLPAPERWNPPTGAVPASAVPPPPPPGAMLPPPPSPAQPAHGPGHDAGAPVSLPSGPPSPWARGAEADSLALGQPWHVGDVSYVTTATPAPTKRSRRLIAVAVAVVLLIGGLATIALVRRQSAQTYGTPDDAVRAFVSALSDRDLLGAAEALAPAERDLAIDLLADWRDAATSGVPTDAQLHAFDGYTLTVDELTTSTETVTDDIAVVELTGGTYAASVDLRKLPFGLSKFAGLFRGGDDEPTAKASGMIGADDEGDPLRLATTRDGDGWHVSLFYSLAEAARANDQLPPPAASERIAAKGAESPEAALRQVAEAAALSDWRRVIELTSPTEMAVLHDYGAMILRDAPERVTEPAVRIERFEFERKSARNATILAPKALSATFRAGDTEGSFELEHTNADCWHVVVRIDGETNTDETGCGSDGFGEVGKDLTTEQRTQLARLQTFVGVAVTEVDGRWYVSPARTIGRLLPIYGTAIGIMTSRTS